MAEIRSYICVGGPFAGERRDSRWGSFFAVVRVGLPSVNWGPFPELPEVAAQVKHIQYREEVFHTPQGNVHFWVPEGQTALQTMELLLTAYQKCPVK